MLHAAKYAADTRNFIKNFSLNFFFHVYFSSHLIFLPFVRVCVCVFSFVFCRRRGRLRRLQFTIRQPENAEIAESDELIG